jgi:uncharacterized protein (TIGR02453 family)
LNEQAAFGGFPPAAFRFLEALERDNSKTTFDAHRSAYEEALLEPARAFVVSLGAELQRRVSLAIHAEPRVNGSIFRINRDTRFRKDKRPYKTHLDLFFWEGEGRSRECPGFFFRMTPRTIVLGAGRHHLQGPELAAYRRAVLDDRAGNELERAIGVVAATGAELGGATYKRVPRGSDATHPRAELLKHTGLFVWRDHPLPKASASPAFAGWCADRLESLAPVHRWLVEHLR